MAYAIPVDLEQLSPYVLSRLQQLQYGQKGELAQALGISLAQLSHYINGSRPIPQKYIPGILGFFRERINLQVVSIDTGEVLKE